MVCGDVPSCHEGVSGSGKKGAFGRTDEVENSSFREYRDEGYPSVDGDYPAFSRGFCFSSCRYPGSVPSDLTIDVTDQLVKSSHEVAVVLTSGLLNLLNPFFTAVETKYVVTTFQLPPLAADEDSQDYGDSAFIAEFIAVQENLDFPVGPTISNICSHLYRVVANLFGSAQTKSEKIGPIIDTWVHGISILVRHRQQNWTSFLQYGGEWERLHSTNSQISRRWCPYILTRVLKADLDAYCQGQDHFISAWFESIIEPDLDGQHALTELLLNVDDENTVLENSVFARNSEGTYQVSSDALFEARPALIVRICSKCYLSLI